MKINYVVLLSDNNGIAYDVFIKSKHYNFTLRHGKLKEAVLINSDGSFKNLTIKDAIDLYKLINGSKLMIS